MALSVVYFRITHRLSRPHYVWDEYLYSVGYWRKLRLGWLLVVIVCLGFTTLLTSQVICVAFYSELEKSDKFCSEALISAWGYFTCRKSMTRDPRLYFPSEGSHTQDSYALKKSIDPRPGLNPRTVRVTVCVSVCVVWDDDESKGEGETRCRLIACSSRKASRGPPGLTSPSDGRIAINITICLAEGFGI